MDFGIESSLFKGKVNLDPRTKLFILIIVNMSAFAIDNWHSLVFLSLLPISLILSLKKYDLAATSAILMGISVFAYANLIDLSSGLLNIIIAMITSLVCRMGPGLLMGYFIINSTTVSELVSAMEKMHVPKQVIIPMSVIFRFIPTIKEELTSINDAMRMRGIYIGSSKGGLFKVMEYRIIPLLISCTKIGEELSCSALTRGLGLDTKRSNVSKVGFKLEDVLYTLITMTIFALSI